MSGTARLRVTGCAMTTQGRRAMGTRQTLCCRHQGDTVRGHQGPELRLHADETKIKGIRFVRQAAKWSLKKL